MMRGKPTRRDLLLVIGELQNIVGQMYSTYANDRAVDRAGPLKELSDRGHQLCSDARSFDPPIEGGSRRGWPYPGPAGEREP